MKTLTLKNALLATAFMLFTSVAVFANENGNGSDSTADQTEALTEEELDAIVASLEDDQANWLNETITHNFYDADDNLIFTAKTERSESANNEKLVKFVAQSDLLMTFENINHYRWNKHQVEGVAVCDNF